MLMSHFEAQTHQYSTQTPCEVEMAKPISINITMAPAARRGTALPASGMAQVRAAMLSPGGH